MALVRPPRQCSLLPLQLLLLLWTRLSYILTKMGPTRSTFFRMSLVCSRMPLSGSVLLCSLSFQCKILTCFFLFIFSFVVGRRISLFPERVSCLSLPSSSPRSWPFRMTLIPIARMSSCPRST
jgi:hypothetical protein